MLCRGTSIYCLSGLQLNLSHIILSCLESIRKGAVIRPGCFLSNPMIAI